MKKEITERIKREIFDILGFVVCFSVISFIASKITGGAFSVKDCIIVGIVFTVVKGLFFVIKLLWDMKKGK